MESKDVKMSIATEDRSIKPCPFCGGVAMSASMSDGQTVIGCPECNPINGLMVYGDTRKEAEQKWNSAPRKSPPARLLGKFELAMMEMAAADLEEMATRYERFMQPKDVRKLHEAAAMLQETAERGEQ